MWTARLPPGGSAVVARSQPLHEPRERRSSGRGGRCERLQGDGGHGRHCRCAVGNAIGTRLRSCTSTGAVVADASRPGPLHSAVQRRLRGRRQARNEIVTQLHLSLLYSPILTRDLALLALPHQIRHFTAAPRARTPSGQWRTALSYCGSATAELHARIRGLPVGFDTSGEGGVRKFGVWGEKNCIKQDWRVEV